MKFLSNETYGSGSVIIGEEDVSSFLNMQDERAYGLSYELDDQNPGCYEAIHARYSPSRRLKNLLFEEHILVSCRQVT